MRFSQTVIEPDSAGVAHGRGISRRIVAKSPAGTCGLNVARPQSCPVVLNSSGGAPTEMSVSTSSCSPRLGAVRVDADGDIDIKPDPAAVPPPSAVAQLPIGDPLHELMKLAGVAMRSVKACKARNVGMTPGVRPLRPRRRRVKLAQHLEAGKAQQRFALLLRKVSNSARRVARRARKRSNVGRKAASLARATCA